MLKEELVHPDLDSIFDLKINMIDTRGLLRKLGAGFQINSVLGQEMS